MENAEELPFDGDFIRDVPYKDLWRRRDAIQLFQDNPLLAGQQFPDLINDLCLFFLHSSNPYEEQCGESTSSRNSRTKNGKSQKTGAGGT